MLLKKKHSKEDAFSFTTRLLDSKKATETISDRIEPSFKTKLKVSETAVQSSILDYLSFEMSQGTLFYQRTNTVGRVVNDKYIPVKGQHKGFPDIFVMYKGRAIFLEVKTHYGKQSDDQIKIQKLLEDQGAEYWLVRSLEFVKRIFSF
jgi:hypothetical protein